MIEELRLNNIRTFQKAEFKFEKGINLVVGTNGSGKTTLLESLGLFAYGKYLTVAKDIYTITKGESVARVEGGFANSGATKAEIGFSHKEKLIKIDDQKRPMSDLIGLIPQVFFNVETVELVFDAPLLRRRELDFVLTQADHEFVVDILTYKRILKERNALLRLIKNKHSDTRELEFWDKRLEEYACKVYDKRIGVVDFFNTRVDRIFATLKPAQGNLRIKYHQSVDYARFGEHLMARRDSDIESGTTSIGPHRDDFSFMLEGGDMRDGASRGEQRLAAVAFKAASCEFLLEKGIRPIIALDDVFSELDTAGRQAIAKMLLAFDSIEQIFLSAIDEKLIPEELKKNAKVIRL